MSIRMWVMETDKYGVTDNKFSIDDPLHIPRIGEFIDSDKAAGCVDHIQYYYNLSPGVEFSLIVNVYLKQKDM